MEKGISEDCCAEQQVILLKQILAVLLEGSSCLGSSINGPQHIAVERIIARFDSKQGHGLANFAADKFLRRFKDSKSHLYTDSGALEYAERLAGLFSLSSEVKERLVRCVAEAGWYGRLEICARNYCGRVPSAAEVKLLFQEYLKSAGYSTSAEYVLAEYAKKYLSPDDAATQIALVQARRERAGY
ncbi:MAG: hypothetical protein PHV42_04425 [Candidatus Pacebacteria bacterium]|nr:hypothetical protein [Candidatus Paceibacterota bacterium]